MGAKFSRRKSESAPAGSEVAAESEVAVTTTPADSTEQQTAEAVSEKPVEPADAPAPEAVPAASPPPAEAPAAPEASEAPGLAGDPEPLTQAAEQTQGTITEQLAVVSPADDVIKASSGAIAEVEAMMAAVSVKEEPVAVETEPEPVAAPEPLVALSEDVAPAAEFSAPDPTPLVDFSAPEPAPLVEFSTLEPAHDPDLLPEPAPLDDLLTSEPITGAAIPEPALPSPPETTFDESAPADSQPLANQMLDEDEEVDVPVATETQELWECVDKVMAPAEPLDCELNLDSTVALDDMVGMETALSAGDGVISNLDI